MLVYRKMIEPQGSRILNNSKLLVLILALFWAHPDLRADAPLEPRAEVAAALKGMADAANAHDVERHVGYYARIPGVTLIVDGEPIVGWNTIRDKQEEWWNNGKTDVVYQLESAPEILELAPDVVVTTLLMKAHRTLPSGAVKEGRFAVSSIWKKGPDGWKVVYSHESTTH
jgi:ketosteroid isomerase-like protein